MDRNKFEFTHLHSICGNRASRFVGSEAHSFGENEGCGWKCAMCGYMCLPKTMIGFFASLINKCGGEVR